MKNTTADPDLDRDDDDLSPLGGPGLDLGKEPPLDTNGVNSDSIDQRGINIRWLCASILTGLAGAALIFSSIYIALRGAWVVAEQPVFVKGLFSPSGKDSDTATVKKSDKIVRAETSISAKQSFKMQTTIRTASGEAIKMRQFIRVSTSLSLSSGVYAVNIPRFNPNRLFNEDGADTPMEETPVEVSDADVAIVKKDLADTIIPDDAPGLSDDDVGLFVNESNRNWNAPAPSYPSQLMLPPGLRQQSDSAFGIPFEPADRNPFNTIDVRVVPENVTSIARATASAVTSLYEERDLVFHKGDSFEDILRTLGATPQQIQSAVAALGGKNKIAAIPDGEHIRVSLAPLGTRAGPKRVARLMLVGERGIEAIAGASDSGTFVSVTPPIENKPSTDAPKANQPNGDEEDDGSGVRLYDSLYETIAKNNIPRTMGEDLVRIFGYDVDFQRRVSSGDSIELFYSQDEDTGAPPELLYASLTIGGDRRPVFRYQGADGMLDFFDPNGRSLKKFLLRKPVADAILRSGFGMRRHPILGYTRLHSGTDWAGRIGVPIVAAGNGTVIKAQWVSGYGQRTEIQHTNGYVTAYSHQSRFANGIVPGAKVKQGQVIGYIGNTGLSTGPHLHYEVIVNGRFVDPMTIRVPRSRELDGPSLADFKRQRDQIANQLEKAGGSPSVRLSQNSSGEE